MLLESATLQKIVTKNVVKISLESTQLQTNFQLILKALKSHDSLLNQFQNKFSTIQQQLSHLSSGHNKNVQNVNQIEKKYDNQIKNVNLELNTSDKRLRKIQAFVEQFSQLNPQSPKQQDENQLNSELLKKMDERVGKVQQILIDLSNKSNKIEELEQGLKKQEQQTKKLAQQLKQLKKITQQLGNKSKNLQQNNSDSQQIKKIKKDVEQLNQKMRTLQSQLKNLKGDISQFNKPLNKLKQVQDQLLKQNKKISDEIWKLNDQIYNLSSQGKQREGQTKNLLDDILKQLEELRILLAKVNVDNRDRTLSAKNQYSLRKPQHQWETQTPTIKAKLDLSKNDIQKDNQDSNFKKEIIDKLKQQKGQIKKAIKRLDLVTLKKDEQDKERINRLQQRIRKSQFLMQGKVDEENLKKWMKYIENKIGYLYRIVNVQITEEDACIARKNWICLSCDKKLESYKGKVGNHLIGAQLKGKTIDAQMVGGGMLFKNKSKLELPQFKK